MNNPLRQYFRRPAIFFKLPSQGNFYPEGSLDLPDNKEIPIYPMTAIDEITTKTPDALFNGTAVTDLIKSCAPNIKDPWDIPVIDLDPLLIAIRIASTGNEMSISSNCPKCNEENSYSVNLTNLLPKNQSNQYDTILDLGELKIKFKPISYKKIHEINMKQFEIQTWLKNLENITDDDERIKVSNETMEKLKITTLLLVSEIIDSISTPDSVVTEKDFILDFLKNCDKATHDKIKNTAIELRKSSDLQPIKMKCMACENQYEQTLTLNVSDFFG